MDKVCWAGDVCAVDSDARRDSCVGEEVEVVIGPAVVIGGESCVGCSASSKTDAGGAA